MGLEGGMEVWAGVHDVLTGLIAAEAGFDALWLSSYGLSVAMLGLPDAGFLTPKDTAAACGRLSERARLPVIVDAENGYGAEGEALERIAKDYFDAGATGICIEDSAGPKVCSLWEGYDRRLA